VRGMCWTAGLRTGLRETRQLPPREATQDLP